MKNVTMIGLGKMGTQMAHRILQGGFSLTVYNRSAEKAQPFEKLGASVAIDIKSAVENADIIVSSLFDDASMIDISNQILDFIKPDSIYIGTATVLPETAQAIAEKYKNQNRYYISASVLGIPEVVKAGGLTTFYTCNESLVEEVSPVLSTFTKELIHLGDDPKVPLVMKISMNYSLITALELISELYVFAEKSGVDLEYIQHGLYQIYGHPAFHEYIDKIKNRDFDKVNFDLTGGLKDVSVFQKAFESVGVTPKLANLVKERYNDALKDNLDKKDWSAIYEVIRKESGLS